MLFLYSYFNGKDNGSIYREEECTLLLVGFFLAVGRQDRGQYTEQKWKKFSTDFWQFSYYFFFIITIVFDSNHLMGEQDSHIGGGPRLSCSLSIKLIHSLCLSTSFSPYPHYSKKLIWSILWSDFTDSIQEVKLGIFTASLCRAESKDKYEWTNRREDFIPFQQNEYCLLQISFFFFVPPRLDLS